MLATMLRAANASGIVFIGSTSGDGSGQDITLAVPAETQTGDFLLAFGYAASAGSLWSVTGGGWTITNASNSTPPRLTAMYRTHAGAADYTFTQNSGSSNIGVSLLVFRGGTFDVASTPTAAADPQVIPSVTAASSGSVQVVTAGGNSDNPDATPSGFTQVYLNTTTQPDWGVYRKANVASGSTGTVSVNMTGSSNTSAMQVIIKPV
jgi:hypothetical protein